MFFLFEDETKAQRHVENSCVDAAAKKLALWAKVEWLHAVQIIEDTLRHMRYGVVN